MKKPTVFVSSTVYDFLDLRSALKYWLSEIGFDAQFSEYNDFQKNLTLNSYDACLQSVSECDYFVLLIGTRRGGLYPNEDISITRKEYRVAYDLAKTGKIKKLIIFIRQSVWDVREDRKYLHKLLQDVTVLENDNPIDVKKIENHSSNILRDAEHIISFIDEVTRKEDARNGNMPNMNWVHTFNSFNDIISTLKIEFKVNVELPVRVAEQNIRMAVVHTLQKIAHKTDSGAITAYYLPFKDIRAKIKKLRDEVDFFTGKEVVRLTTEDVHNMSNFLLFYYTGVEELTTYDFENALSSGVFMDFDIENGTPTYNNFCRMLHQLIEEINRVKKFVREFSRETQLEMMNQIRYYHKRSQEFYDFDVFDLAQLSSIYERLMNIQHISFYLIQCMDNKNKSLELPVLMNGFIKSERPLEADILRIFNSNSQ